MSEFVSRLPPADIQRRIADATDVRAPSSQRVLEIRAHSPAPTLGARPLPSRDFLWLRELSDTGFKFEYSFNRTSFEIIGTISIHESGSRLTVMVPPPRWFHYLGLIPFAAFVGFVYLAAHSIAAPLIGLVFMGLSLGVAATGRRLALQCIDQIVAVAEAMPVAEPDKSVPKR